VVTPYYNKGSAEGRYLSYRHIADNSGAPIIVYNVPSRCGVGLGMDEYRRLSEIEMITAVKEASGNMALVCSLASELGERFDIYSGNDELALPTISVGGRGVISVVSNILPRECAYACHCALDGKINEARDGYHALMPVIHAMFCDVNPIPIKYALSRMGRCACEYRLPLCPPDERVRDRVDGVLRKYGLI
jgi:4-hydroxy-tetrahydrodipicolinate synthase